MFDFEALSRRCGAKRRSFTRACDHAARLVGAFALAFTLGAAHDAFADAKTVRVEQGVLGGLVSGPVTSFLDIPYAAPPVGDLRWRAPRPPAGWPGVRDATAFGPSCLQSGVFTGVAANQSEDCLTLNVWTPTAHAAKKLPVMVWLHGGAFLGGSSSAPFYDGAAFARDGVVMVSLNYRLGRLGWYAHPSLLKESGPHGNYGLLDQIAALKWVKANIAAFGGDPDNVTLFGESAGGIAVNFLMISPQAHGLFQKAISQSGFGRFDAPPIATMASGGARYAAGLGVTGEGPEAAAALRALPATAFLEPVRNLLAPDAPHPMIDGDVVPERIEVGFAAGRQLKIPFLLGGNSFEASLFGPAIGAAPDQTLAMVGDSQKALALFGDGEGAKRAAFNLVTARFITEPNRNLARQHAKSGSPVYLYYFSYVPTAERSSRPGAGHGSEVSFAFDTLSVGALTYTTRPLPLPTPEDLAISRAMHAYWVAFAKHGAPGKVGSVAWPAFKLDAQALLEFGVGGPKPAKNLQVERLDALSGLAGQQGQ